MFTRVNSKGFGESAQCIFAFACHMSPCATSNNCYIGKAQEILVRIVHVSKTANADASKVDILEWYCSYLLLKTL